MPKSHTNNFSLCSALPMAARTRMRVRDWDKRRRARETERTVNDSKSSSTYFHSQLDTIFKFGELHFAISCVWNESRAHIYVTFVLVYSWSDSDRHDCWFLVWGAKKLREIIFENYWIYSFEELLDNSADFHQKCLTKVPTNRCCDSNSKQSLCVCESVCVC